MFGKIKEKRRLKKIGKELPYVIDMLANAVRAGLSLQQAIEMTSALAEGPLSRELQDVSRQIALGNSVDNALTDLSKRIPLQDVDLLVEGLVVLRRSGGNIAEMLQVVSGVIRERQKIEERIRVTLSQGIQQAAMILVLPFALVVALAFISRWYVAYLFSDPVGWLMCSLALGLQIAGGLWIRQIIKIKV